MAIRRRPPGKPPEKLDYGRRKPSDMSDEMVFGELATLDPKKHPEHVARADQLFGEFYRRHAQKLRSIVSGVLRDRSEIDDVIQNAFKQAWIHRGSATAREHPGRWVIGIATNEARTRRRTVVRERNRTDHRPPRELFESINSLAVLLRRWSCWKLGRSADARMIDAESSAERHSMERILKFALIEVALEKYRPIPSDAMLADEAFEKHLAAEWTRLQRSMNSSEPQPFFPARGFLCVMLIVLKVGHGLRHEQVREVMQALLSARRRELVSRGEPTTGVMDPAKVNIPWLQKQLERAIKRLKQYLLEHGVELRFESTSAWTID